MSQPKRWGLCWTAKVEDPEQGAWVEYADYAALAAENERLRKAGDANNVRQAECIRKFAELLLEFEFKVEANPNDKILRNICYDARRALNEALHGRFPEGLDGKGYDSGFHQNLILRYKEGRDAK